ncbi:MAG: helix-turn-helix transcriptional regulator [Ruminococcaceae bacterium]|nr:helix-turn-helix transcriptional regulator [Oscillospiraceae bacterium]
MNNRIFKPTRELIPFITEMIRNNKKVQLTVTGNSMFPLLTHLRDSVTVKGSDNYKKYDIILYVRNNGDLILHRIVKVKKGIYYLCGDNQTVIEYPIYKDQIIGKVVSVKRKDKDFDINNIIYCLYSFFWCLNVKIRKPALRIALKIWGVIKNEK